MHISDQLTHLLHEQLPVLLDDVLSHERFRLQRELHQLQKALATAATRDADDMAVRSEALHQAVSASVAKVAERREKIPAIHFPEALPISEKREQIAQAIAEHQVVVLAGETGSGKTTQLPKICLALGRGVRGLIGHTQPRRIAARTVASRIADELSVPLGESVGYQVRFNDQASPHTHIKLMTDGILLAEIQRDRYLSRYDTLIIDEAHERSLNIDFLLGYLKQLLPKRPDLKVIITSATIDVARFADYFNQAPVIEVSGRTFPVEVHYRPALDTDTDDLYRNIINALHEIVEVESTSGQAGDILVFLSGEREIREAALQIRREQLPHLEVLPLYARLTIEEQNKIFASHRGRRVVLATNVAETSLTVPGIRYVIDPGFARISRYSFRTKVQRLPIEAISQASANQRKGRCGRVSEGVCIRLYGEDDFLSRPEFTDAEIQRTNLAAVILQMAQLRLGDVREFPFIDPPDQRLINDGYQLLQELQAITDKGRLTPLGRQLAQLPIDPRLGRMVLAAVRENSLHDVAIIVSALSVQDPRDRPADKQQAADQKHREYWDEHSDFIAYLNVWNSYEQQRQLLSKNQLQKWCKKQFLAPMRMREWRDIHRQLLVACQSLGFKDTKAHGDNRYIPVAVADRSSSEHKEATKASFVAIHKALVTGLLGMIGQRTEDNDYLGARNRRFALFPGSSQFKKSHKWVMAAQLLETSKLYAHGIAKIEVDWVLACAEHLVKRHYFEPHYHAKSGQVMAYEKISVYGLVLVEKKRVNFSAVDIPKARSIFIQEALAVGRYGESPAVKPKLHKATAKTHFFLHQQALLNDLHELEAKARRQDIVVDEQVLCDFYDERLPADIVNIAGFEAWRKKAERTQPTLLMIDRERLMQHSAAHITEAQFPNTLTIDGLTLPLSYHFEPNHPDDGVSLLVPMGMLHLIDEHRLQWLVPGLLREKCIALVKQLPKQWRKHFVPVPQYVDKALPKIQANGQSLIEALAEQLQRQTGIEVPVDLWSTTEMDDYYRMNIHILDDQSVRIDRGRDLSVLRERYRDHVQQQLQAVDNDIERECLTAWDFDQLPESYDLQRNSMTIKTYPGLVDQQQHVALVLCDNPIEANAQSLRGMTRLALLMQKESVQYLNKQLLRGKDIGLTVANMGGRQQVVDDILCAAAKTAFFADVQPDTSLPRQRQAFMACIEAGRSDLVSIAQQIETLLVACLSDMVSIKKQLKQAKNPLSLAYAGADIQQQLNGLLYPGCLYETPYEWLQQYPRYFKAILLRLEKVPMQVAKDRQWIAEMATLSERLSDRKEALGASAYALNQPLQDYRWMLEELRISLFAQTVKTRMPISAKRLNKQWQLC